MTRCFSAPAKVNLSLKIVGRRGDGYHLLSSVMTFFPWFDTLEVTCGGNGIALDCHPKVTVSQEDNLVYRAALKLQEAAGIRQGVALRLIKEIPHGAGLGGGSSDAAVVLLALNRMWGLDWPIPRLSQLGLELGADIPFFLGGCCARVSGIGEKLVPYPDCPELDLVVVYPGTPLSTAEIYRGVTPQMLAAQPTESPYGGEPYGGEPYGGEKDGCFGWTFANDLEQIARRLTPMIDEACGQLVLHGATTALMSGSGSAVFGIFDHPSKATAACAALSQEQPLWRSKQGRSFAIHPFDREWQSGI